MIYFIQFKSIILMDQKINQICFTFHCERYKNVANSLVLDNIFFIYRADKFEMNSRIQIKIKK